MVSTNTRPVLNLNSAIGYVKDGLVYLRQPWNSFFQQFVQQAPAVVNINLASSPYQANQNGKVIIKGATSIQLTRGQDTVNINGQLIVPVSIGDIVAWSGPVTSVQFWGN